MDHSGMDRRMTPPALTPSEALAKAIRDADMCHVLVITPRGQDIGGFQSIAEIMLGVLAKEGYALTLESGAEML
jgi:hypothetical protein